METVGIKFKKDGNTYNFSTDIDLKKGDKVIVETERGLQLGVVETLNPLPQKTKNLKNVERLATEDDYDLYLKNLKDSQKALSEIREEVKKMALNMNIIDATYSLDKKQLVYNFVSDERVDFRELVKVLAAKFHTRIELHQVGVRDKAKEIGGIGLCGRPLCCSSCLKNISTVNINMVKNQNIALNPTKINGACGRLLCCFNYENDIYEENRKKLPKVGEKVKHNGFLCEVVEIDVLAKKYKIKVGENSLEEVIVSD